MQYDMELKVWVEGIQRIVCGVTNTTTCQDVVYALAHATGKSGRFTLIERWRNNERQLAPNENPLKVLMKWGEYSNDVQFILQCSDGKNVLNLTTKSKIIMSTVVSQFSTDLSVANSHKGVQKSNNATSENVGVVKGIPHVKNAHLQVKDTFGQSSQKPRVCTDSFDSPSQRIAPPYKDPPVPPPYRNPPPPTSHSYSDNHKNNILQELNKPLKNTAESRNKLQRLEEQVLYNSQYKELVSLINFQREKLSSQEADLTKFDAEIVYWEGKEKEKQLQLDYITNELTAVTATNKLNQEQIQALSYVEEESEIVKQQEKTLKSEITLLRSKLANCETELLQCKNKIRLVMDELQMEQRAQLRRNESKKQYELNLLAEVEGLQHDIELAKQSTEIHHLTAETLKKEVAHLENAIIEKKKQVEYLVTEMKEANLQSLTISPPEDQLRHILEGQNKSGSTRRMMCSPRQLENAVPTNKNPHGVWV